MTGKGKTCSCATESYLLFAVNATISKSLHCDISQATITFNQDYIHK